MKGRMPFRMAMDLTPDDLPDGAFFAMAHEIAGLEYGEGFAELVQEKTQPRRTSMNHGRSVCHVCGKSFRKRDGMRQHRRDKHPELEGR